MRKPTLIRQRMTNPGQGSKVDCCRGCGVWTLGKMGQLNSKVVFSSNGEIERSK
jgi:hypothetical protein